MPAGRLIRMRGGARASAYLSRSAAFAQNKYVRAAGRYAYKYASARFKARRAAFSQKFKKVRRRKPRSPGFGVSLPRSFNHSGLRTKFNHNQLNFCISLTNRMYSVPRNVISALPTGSEEKELLNLYDSFVTSNNGTGALGTPPNPFTGRNITNYVNIASLTGYTYPGCWFLPAATTTPLQAPYSSQVYKLRSFYKKWRLAQTTVQIKWKGHSAQNLAIPTPKGFYAVFNGAQKKKFLDSAGHWLATTAAPSSRAASTVVDLTPAEQLKQIYGSPALNDATAPSPGSFPNDAGLAQGNIQEFTYDTIREASKGSIWTPIPNKQTIDIVIKHKTPFTQSQFTEGAGHTPIILMVFENMDFCNPTTTVTTGVLATATGTGQAISTTSVLSTTGPNIHPQIIADIQTLYCFSFKDRSQEMLDLNLNVLPAPLTVGTQPY